MKQIKAQNFKAKILADIAPEGFNARAFSLDLRMIQKPTPTRPNARIMTNDGGWIEIDSARNIVRTWGPKGRAQVLAAALAALMDVEVAHLAETASVAAEADALKVAKLSEDQTKSLAQWWMARGYTATSAPEGAWINVGGSRLHDTGNRITVHGGLTEQAIAAMILKGKEAWGGSMELIGKWSQSEQDRLWIAAQRAGVEIANCWPSKSAEAEWQREQERAITHERTISAARCAIADAADVRDAAAGDDEAINRLPEPLQAFIVSYLDDDQRKELSGKSVADITAALPHFQTLGADELADYERRTGRKFNVPRRRHRDHDRVHEDRLDIR